MKTFKETFCHHLGCPPEKYAHKALSRCFYPHARVFVGIMGWLGSRTLAESIAFIEDVGESQTRHEMDAAIQDYHYRLKLQGTFLARVMKFRVSGSAVTRLSFHIKRMESSAEEELAADPNILPKLS
jgi:hypothetical protein